MKSTASGAFLFCGEKSNYFPQIMRRKTLLFSAENAKNVHSFKLCLVYGTKSCEANSPFRNWKYLATTTIAALSVEKKA